MTTPTNAQGALTMPDLTGTPNNDTLTGSGAILIDGGDGNDWLSTTDGASTLKGGAGNDYLYVDGNGILASLPDAVALEGGAGDDVYEVNLKGGGRMFVTIDPRANAGSPNLETEGLRLTGGGTYASGAFSLLREGADLLVLNEAQGSVVRVKDNFYQPVEGGKTYSAIDWIEMGGRQFTGAALDQLLAQAATAPLPQLVSTEGDDTLVGTWRDDFLRGLGGNDVLLAGIGNDTLSGGLGADTMEGGAGNDFYFVDNAGDVVKEVSVANSPTVGGNDTVSTNLTQYTLPTGVEALSMGSKQNADPGSGDTFTAKAGVRHGVGNELNNVMTSGGGDVFFEGGKGADSLVGGDGNDTLAGSFYTGTDADPTLDDFTQDTLMGGAGNDTYTLIVSNPDGNFYDHQRDFLVEWADGGIDTVITNITSYELVAGSPGRHIENVFTSGRNVTGNDLNNQLTGNAKENVLFGDQGDDTLIGAGGQDALFGGAGNDTLLGGGLLFGGAGNDLMKSDDAGSNDHYIWHIEQGHDVIEDAGGMDWLELRDWAATPRTTRFDRVGDDLIIANLNGAHSCTVRGWFAEGGAQRMEYVVQQNGGYLGAAQIEQMVAVWATVPPFNPNNPDLEGQLSPTVRQTLADLWQPGYPALGTEAFSGITGLGTVPGSSADDVLKAGAPTSNAGISARYSGELWDFRSARLLGFAGNDTLLGNAGNDTLDGGVGADSMAGGDGRDTYHVDDLGDVVNDLSGYNTLVVARADYRMTDGTFYGDVTFAGDAQQDRVLWGSRSHEDITGQGGNDLLLGGYGSDTIVGGAGNDTLGGLGWVTLAAGSVADADYEYLAGGQGDDLYLLNNREQKNVDRVLEEAQGGYDTVETNSLFYRMPDQVEALAFSGQMAWGNGLDNLMEGGGTLDGGLGNDTLSNAQVMEGGAGNDLVGSTQLAAANTYVWGANQGMDVVNDLGGTDLLKVTGITEPSRVNFRRVGDDLQLVLSTDNHCLIKGWFGGSATGKIEFFQLDDGRSITAADVDAALTNSQGALTSVSAQGWLNNPASSAAERAGRSEWGDAALGLTLVREWWSDRAWIDYLHINGATSARVNGSTQADTILASGEVSVDLWGGQGNDWLRLDNSRTQGGVYRLDGGQGDDQIDISATYSSAKSNVIVTTGQGHDTLSITRNAYSAQDLTVALQAGQSLNDLRLETRIEGVNNDKIVFRGWSPAWGDDSFDLIVINGASGSDPYYKQQGLNLRITDGQSALTLDLNQIMTEDAASPPNAVIYNTQNLRLGGTAQGVTLNSNDEYRLYWVQPGTWNVEQPVVINETGGKDKLWLDTEVGTGDNAENLDFRRAGQDLLITVYRTTDNPEDYGYKGAAIQIKNWFTSASNQIETIRFGSDVWDANRVSKTEYTLTAGNVQSLVDAMAAFPAPVEGLGNRNSADLIFQYATLAVS
jgi:Ca2+-binding RTX toxin-like protein